MALLVKAGIDRSQANAAITALREVFDPAQSQNRPGN